MDFITSTMTDSALCLKYQSIKKLYMADKTLRIV